MEGEITREDIEKNKWLAGLSYGWILFIFYWLVDSNFVKFHAKQSLTISIAEVFFVLSKPILSFLPNYGIFADIMVALLLILRIIGFIYGITGQVKKVPIIGDLSEKLPL
jgi:uncharacterized membrane protein